MKKNILFVLIAFAFLAVSCQKENKVEFYDLGSEIYISSTEITSLDDQVVVTVENPINNLSSVTVTHAGTTDADGDAVTVPSADLGSVTFSGGEGTLTLTDAQLGLDGSGYSANIEVDAEFNGKPFMRSHHIDMASPFSTHDPGITHRDDTLYYFEWAVEPIAATVTDITIETKVGANDTYIEAAGTWAAIDSISFDGSNYNVGDTIFVQITAETATKTDTEVAALVIGPYIENMGSFTLEGYETTNVYAFDIIEGEEVLNDDDSADVFWVPIPPGGMGPPTANKTSAFALASDYNMEFLVATSDDYANADALALSNTDFSAASTFVEATPGAVFMYRTYRDAAPTEYYYGILKVTATDMAGGDWANSSIEIEYKY